MSNHSLLNASQEKIKRAKAKFDYLKSLINGYIESRPYSVIKKSDLRSDFFIARREKELPEDVAWETVEAIGQLRSALDKLVVDLVDFNGGGISGVAFPFGGMSGGKPDIFPTTRHDHLKKKLTPSQWDMIIAQKPYPGGNDALWAIHEIANADKHRRGLVAVSPRIVPANLSISQGVIDRLTYLPTNANAILDDPEREMVLIKSSILNHSLKINQTLSVDVVFGGLLPVTGKNILVTLNQQIRLLEAMVKIFKTTFF